MAFDFLKQKREGKLACKVVELRLLTDSRVAMVESMEDHPDWREMGVDLSVNMRDGRKLKVEVKADSYPMRNAFLETCGNVDRDTEGCFFTSEADVWIYYYTTADTALWLPLADTQAWLRANAEDFDLREVRNRGWSTAGRLVPVERVVEEVEGVKVLENVWATVKRRLDEQWMQV